MLLRVPLQRLSYTHYKGYWHDLVRYTGKMERLRKCEKGLTASVYPSIEVGEMSVKSFLDKYFKTDTSSKVVPETILEPMVGTIRREEIKVVPVPTQVYSNPFHLFTDGACSDNGKRTAKGGYGVHVYSDSRLDISRRLYPNEPQTNNRAELRGIQAALDLIDQHGAQWLENHTEIRVWSDSEYSIHCLTKWAGGWKKHGWKKSDGGSIQNIDLIKPLYERLERMPRVKLQHVRAHQAALKGEFPFDGNHKADLLATQSLR
jgi:ribonuclease HI